MDMNSDLIEFLNFFGGDNLLMKVSVFVTSCRLFMKPIFTFWEKKVTPFVTITPSEKLLKHPVYKAFAFMIDWVMSVKLPKEKQ